MRPKLLDLFCKAGGAGMGYHRAGFDVTGVDIEPQKHYPFTFIQAPALWYLRRHYHEYDVIHTSPPCQGYSQLTSPHLKFKHPLLIEKVRKNLMKTGLPYIIENVSGARFKMKEPVKLCGSMFGLNIHRHRFFEIGCNVLILTHPCKHDFIPVLISGVSRRLIDNKRKEHSIKECSTGMGIDWMIKKELDEAIPPAYTEYIGTQIIKYLQYQKQHNDTRTKDLAR